MIIVKFQALFLLLNCCFCYRFIFCCSSKICYLHKTLQIKGRKYILNILRQMKKWLALQATESTTQTLVHRIMIFIFYWNNMIMFEKKIVLAFSILFPHHEIRFSANCIGCIPVGFKFSDVSRF